MAHPVNVPGVVDAFWARVREGRTMTQAGLDVGIERKTSYRWEQESGGVLPPVPVPASGRYLSLAEREEIAIGLALGESGRSIERRLGRSAGTLSRETARNSGSNGHGGRLPYRASSAHNKAKAAARRPKPAKLVTCPRLRARVARDLGKQWSPRQISHRLVRAFPDDESMRISHEAIYQSLFVQSRGALNKELAENLRSRRTTRKRLRRSPTGDAPLPGIGAGDGRGKFKGMLNISQRPAEAADRAVPGHWEGDLIIGKGSTSAIGTLVERTTRYVLLLHLPARPDGASYRGGEAVRDAMATAIASLPEHLWRSLTWDQGTEMARHHEITIAHDLPIYFCDPHSPWQRGSNENTNGLLRQYFPKGTDLSRHSAAHLQEIAVRLNGRPRQTLDWMTPAKALHPLLSPPTNENEGAVTTG